MPKAHVRTRASSPAVDEPAVRVRCINDGQTWTLPESGYFYFSLFACPRCGESDLRFSSTPRQAIDIAPPARKE